MTQPISGQSDWFEITQAQINQFADATHDHQYLHVDPQRAAEGPLPMASSTSPWCPT